MGLFDRNPNEQNYVGGKKHWTDVIKNSGPGELLIWRQPEEDFNNNSTLIVMPGEYSIFINEGKVEQVFENGTYKLDTKNYPFISRLKNAFSGGISTFNCVVYFVRKSDSEEIKWGTDSPIQVRDKVWGIRTDAKVRGAYKVKIINPSLFLTKLIGNNVLSQEQIDLNKYFSSELQGKIKTAVSKFLNGLEQELIGIDAYLDDLSTKIEPNINEALSDYGLECVKFSLEAIDIDATKYDALDASQIELIARQRGYQGDKSGLEILGDDWAKTQGYNLLKDLANNPNSGGAAATGAGLGMGIGAAGAFGSIAQQVFAPTVNAINGANQNTRGNQSRRFQQRNDSNSGNDQNKKGDPMESLKKLKELLDAGLIEQSEYDNKKTEILSKM